MKKLALFIMLSTMILLIAVSLEAKSGSVRNSKHNLSVTGEGDVKSSSETRVCIFCHSSHNSSTEGPLWNHQTTSGAKFRTYDRTTLEGRPEQPNGATKLCLSCHDGTIAVGAIKGFERPIPMRNVGASGEIPTGRKSNIGTDLSGTHPVSIKYQQSTALSSKHLRWPPFDPEGDVKPDANGYVQCTSCHDPHDDSKSEKYPFWNKKTYDEVCEVCHSM